ncbi:MAG TPA: hypothetical protein VGG46_04260 [Terriglobales bacterium]|jgi:hypothetical protein
MGLLETSLEVVKIAGKLANPELIQAATKANVEALELSQQNLELQRRLAKLDDKIRELDDKLKLTGMVFRAPENTNVVFLEGDRTGFCSHCWDAERRLIHVIRMNNANHSGLGCPHCKTMLLNLSVQNPRMKTAVNDGA